MRLGLFWKILLGFWVTILLIAQGMWVLFGVIGPLPSLELGIAHRVGRVAMIAAVDTLREYPSSEFASRIATWPQVDRSRLIVSPAPGVPLTRGIVEAEREGRFTAVVDDRAGQRVRLEYRPNGNSHTPPRATRHIPIQLLLVGALGGLAFSAALAWYLTRPIRRLRNGFERLARGELATRLATEMGPRHDELADLASDFDRMAEQLEAFVTTRDQLLHDVSHELRSPLARLQLAVALARQDRSMAEIAFDRVEREVARIDEIVGDLLALARLESGHAQVEDYLDLVALIEVIVADAAFEADGRVMIVSEIAHDARAIAEQIRGNAELLRRAIENVVRNAVRHSPSGGRVTIALAFADEMLKLSVRDEGRGVTPALLPRIFEPFVRGPAHGSGLTGVGLGLAIARRSVLAHGGSVAAANLPSGGLEIQIMLPRSGGGNDDQMGQKESNDAYQNGMFGSHDAGSGRSSVSPPQLRDVRHEQSGQRGRNDSNDRVDEPACMDLGQRA